MLVSILAQLTPGEITDLVGEWTPFLAFVVPFILGVAVRYDVVAEVKQAIAVLFAVVVAAVTIGSEDWSEVTAQLFFARAAIAWGIVETTYRVVNGVLAGITLRNLNQWLLPRVGLALGKLDSEKTDRLYRLPSKRDHRSSR